MATWVEKVTGSLEDKRRYRQYQARAAALPQSYRVAIEAVERYLTYYGGIASGAEIVRMFDDLIVLFEQAAADGTPIRSVVGEDPVEFVEVFVANYSAGRWINKERQLLIEAMRRAEQVEGGLG